MRFQIRLFLTALILLLLSVAASAQQTKGFQGTVLDRDGNPAVGVKVKFIDQSNTNNVFETETNEKGRYIYAGLPYATDGYNIVVKVGELPEVIKYNKKPKLLERIRVDFDMREDLTYNTEAAEVENHAADAKDLYDFGEYEGALEKIELAIAAEDNVKAMMFLKAASLVQLDRLDEALAACKAYESAYPEPDGNRTAILGQMAQIYKKKGDKKLAAEYQEKFKQSGGVIQNESYNEGAKALQAGDVALAEQKFRQAIEENPRDGEAQKGLGLALARQGKNAEAVTHLRKYLELVPDAPDKSDQEALIGYLSQ